eukprot:5658468-Alexandrium_andersonii.AAC.1
MCIRDSARANAPNHPHNSVRAKPGLCAGLGLVRAMRICKWQAVAKSKPGRATREKKQKTFLEIVRKEAARGVSEWFGPAFFSLNPPPGSPPPGA